MERIEKTDAEWKRELTLEQYRVLREKGTEPPFSGALLNVNENGEYACAACGAVLFDSGRKFDGHCGWPSFDEAKPGAVVFTPDDSHGMRRTEVTCARCGGHLGHVFDDGPPETTGKRFCINSAALAFRKAR